MGLRERLTTWFAADSPVRRGLVVALVCVVSAALLTDWRLGVSGALPEGSVASTDVVAPYAFAFIDEAATAERRASAEAQVAPVFEVDQGLLKKLESQVEQAFDMGRRRMLSAQLDAQAAGRREPPPEVVAAIARDFATALEIAIEPAALDVLVQHRFGAPAEALVVELLAVGLRRPVIRDARDLPNPSRPVTVVSVVGGEREENTITDFGQLRTPEEARQAISLHVLERYQGTSDPAMIQSVATVARGMIRPNFSANQVLTEERRAAARTAVEPVEVQVRRGARIVRAGDVVDARQAAMASALREADDSVGAGWRFSVWLAFTLVVVLAPVGFARTTMRKFARREAELEAMGLILLLVLGVGRLLLSTGDIVKFGGDPHAVASLLVPVAGGAMLVRILVNSESALVFAVVSSVLSAALMDASALSAGWYLVTATVAAGAVGQARERLNVLRAGALAGVVGAGLVLLVALVQAQGAVAGSSPLDWSSATYLAIAAFAAGILGAMMVLGLVPAMEALGFLTDYKLFELANLNHPLLRKLMLQAPGTYHHSVIVGSLSEAACETIGANALLARVACYFHDIGKGVKPQYFVENQRDGQNRHDRLTPEQSAQIVINHVRDGGTLARQHNLPRPIFDNIFMHHGTGLIPYFYNRAKEQSGGEPIDEARFRYPGPKPNTREAGIIMLADKVEAACRTIREPSEERFRAMIQAIINNVMSDGQLEECPITLKELYRIADAFVAVLLGIYHHRVEYPTTRAISSGTSAGPAKFVPVPKQGTITLEIASPLRPAPPGATTLPNYQAGAMPDYESVETDPERTRLPDTDD